MPEGSVVANEHWDDGLPFSLDGKISFKPAGMYYGLTQPDGRRDGQIENYAEDTPEKREALYRWLNDADILVLSSNRLWGSIPRLPMRFPMTKEYYQLLFDGKLGFELAARFTSFPTIFGLSFDDTGAEEAFSVYDHPEVRIYRKTSQYNEALVRSYFDQIDLENTIQMWPKQVTQAPTALLMTPQEAAIQQAGGTWSGIFDLDSLINRSPILSVLVWLALVIVLGLAAFPITFVVLRRLPDRGYGVAKTLGLLLLAWLSWFAPALKLTSYSRAWIAFCLGAACRHCRDYRVAAVGSDPGVRSNAPRAVAHGGGYLPRPLPAVPLDPHRQSRPVAPGARRRETDGVRLPQRGHSLNDVPAV